MKTVNLSGLDTFDAETGDVTVIIETPRSSRNKFKYDTKNDLFRLSKTLPSGVVFPFDFGFLPSTLGEDGDPLDVMIFMDEPVFPGNLVPARLIGVLEAEQTEEGKTVRNDRLMAVASASHQYGNVKELADLDARLLAEIEHFFMFYNQMQGRKFKPLGRPDARHAQKLLEAGRKRFEQKPPA